MYLRGNSQKLTYSAAPQRTYSSMFGSFNSKCLRLCYIYCRFGEQLLALCWWVGQVSTTEHSYSWLLPHVSQNRYLHNGENSVFPVCDPRQNQLSFPHFADSWCSSGRFFMVAACDQVLKTSLFLQGQSGQGADTARMGQ